MSLACVAALLTACVPCTPERCCASAVPEVPEAAVEAPPTTVEARYRALAEQNLCPDGVAFLQDTWRFVGESGTPEFQDELTIEGTHFTERLSGRPGGGPFVEATLEGEIRCIEDNRVLIVIDSVAPAGAFGNQEGDAYPCDVLNEISGRSRRILLMCFFDWDLQPAAGREFEYERTGG